MKRTGEELLEWFGLKVGDIVRVSMELGTTDFIVIKYENGWYKLRSKVNGREFRDKISFLLDKDFEIIKPMPKLTEDEKVILRNLPKECKWIVREKDDRLWVHEEIPTRSLEPCGWERRSVNSLAVNLVAFNHIFQFITWEDEPYNIEELLKGNE